MSSFFPAEEDFYYYYYEGYYPYYYYPYYYYPYYYYPYYYYYYEYEYDFDLILVEILLGILDLLGIDLHQIVLFVLDLLNGSFQEEVTEQGVDSVLKAKQQIKRPQLGKQQLAKKEAKEVKEQ